NALFCIRFKTWKAYQNLTPVASARAYIAGRRGAKMIDIYRSAGLLLILVTVAHGQTAPKLSAYCTRQEFNQLNCLEPRRSSCSSSSAAEESRTIPSRTC